MKRGRRIWVGLGVLTLILGLATFGSQAQGVQGGILFHGNGATTSQMGGTSTVTFTQPLLVDVAFQDFRGIPGGTPASFAPISWTGSGMNAVLASNNSPEWTINFAGTTYQYSITRLYNAFSGTFMGMDAAVIVGEGIATISGAIHREATFLNFGVQALGGETSFFVENIFCSPFGSCGPRLVPETGSGLVFLVLAITSLELLRRRWLAT